MPAPVPVPASTTPTARSSATMGRVIDWLFRNRRTGEITIAQFPNIPLGVFIVAAAVRYVAHPHGTVGTGLDVVAGVALVVWALDELVRGVNPWRRILGGTVLVFEIVGLILR